MTTITLYNKAECPFCWKIRLALAELGLATQVIDHQDEQHLATWQALTPNKTVPVLVHNDIVIYESNVILEYLNDITNNLLLKSPSDRVMPRLINQYSDSVVGKGLREVIFEKRGKVEHEWDITRINSGVELFEIALAHLSTQLGDKEFFAGHYSFAECALTARFGLAEAYGVEIPSRFANLKAWLLRMKSRPSYQQTAPQICFKNQQRQLI